MKYELIIADYDGFLVDSKPWRDEFYFLLCLKHKKPCPGRAAHEMSDGIPRKMRDEYVRLGFEWPADKKMIWEEFISYSASSPPPIFMPVLAALCKAKQREVMVALVTMNRGRVIFPFIEKNRLEGLFDSITTEEDGNEKTELFIKTAEKLRIHPSRCICIGDHILDVQAAKNAGMFPLAAGYGGFIKPEILLQEIAEEQLARTPADVWPTIARYL